MYSGGHSLLVFLGNKCQPSDKNYFQTCLETCRQGCRVLLMLFSDWSKALLSTFDRAKHAGTDSLIEFFAQIIFLNGIIWLQLD